MTTTPPHIVILGGGFAGLYAAKRLGSKPVTVTLVDKRNFHLFQPLLYQVATGGLSPGDITYPLRAVLGRHANISVLQAEVADIDVNQKRILLRDGELSYDTLIVATGASHHYFGNDQWMPDAPGLKTIEDALEIRRRIFLAFETAEREPDPARREAWMTFVIVGAGPTGVEMAGAVAELAYSTLKNDFRHINTTTSRILLLEGTDRVLPPYPPDLSAKSKRALEDLGVTVQTSALVTNIQPTSVTYKQGNDTHTIPTRTVLWAAGMKASGLGATLAKKTGVELDRAGRVQVQPDLTVPDHPDIFVIGDLACFTHQSEKPVPGVAPAAMQMGRYAAERILNRIQGKAMPTFRYRDKGSLAVIGRNAAVADFGVLRFNGFPAWFAWVFIHIAYLIEFDNKFLVLFQWAWNYITRKRGARLITGPDPFPLIEPEDS
ncbi:MAG: NAD(P)/FAD-dependent oxidoreductase [bacterium]|nr:NAD(P)/FAD-dependent oxidoreductase [bacterium]